MEFEELLLEEIITIVKEAKDENFMRLDLKRLLSVNLEKHEKMILEKFGQYTEEEYNEAVDNSWKDGYSEGWDAAFVEMTDKMDDIRENIIRRGC